MLNESKVISTKLQCPRLPAKWVSRPDLLSRLDSERAIGRNLTLVSAPAGFGKTACVAEWITTRIDKQSIWLSLESSDDDPIRFVTYLVASLQAIDSRIGEEIEGTIRDGELPPAEIVSEILLRDIASCGSPFELVIDDIHLIQDATALAILERLVMTPPQLLGLTLITREDPPISLARLRANGRLSEIRARELHFQSDDIARLLNEVYALRISTHDIEILESRTEGWVVGLTLAAISLKEREDPSALIAELSGSHRFILEYLVEQVLEALPGEVRTFLLETSILDSFCDNLCDAVTGRSDSGEMLRRVERSNLFIVALDEVGKWYRYHNLFLEVLRELEGRRDACRSRDLHRRAFRWFEDASRPREAIRHALAAEEYGAAHDLIESHAPELIADGHAKSLGTWLAALPDEWANRCRKGRLAIAWMHFFRGKFDDALPFLEGREAVANEEAQASPEIAEELTMHALLAGMRGEPDESLSLARGAERRAPEGGARVRGLVSFAIGNASDLKGDFPNAVASLQKAITLGRDAGNLLVEVMSSARLGAMAIERAQLALAEDIARPMIRRAERSESPSPLYGLMYGLLAEVDTQRYRLDDARRHWLQANRYCTLGGYSSGRINCAVQLARFHRIQGDYEAAARQLERAALLMHDDTPEYVRREAVAERTRLYLDQGLGDAALTTLTGEGFRFDPEIAYPIEPPPARPTHSAGLLVNSALRYLLLRSREAGSPAIERWAESARRFAERAIREDKLLVAIEAILIHGQMASIAEKSTVSETMLTECKRALELAKSGGVLACFLEQGAPVANALSRLLDKKAIGGEAAEFCRRVVSRGKTSIKSSQGSRPPATPESEAIVERLTAREIDVLHLLATGLLYKEAADRLNISTNTVRFHVKSIYGKLDANNRTQALQRARSLGLF